ncbi:MAG: MerR family transcriptional regulator [Anaerolineae bacterium]|jgi:MerR family transcriptional regulator, aldehyde-responsive regulator|nr:MerR family transcriptional regulator [Anaerolineae bacterium]MBT5102060.1 MerR family transcriptional regulator [Planctomycetota bacterium]MBT7070543.1 MerR family transcriptional regulator [Anaerolineae bacterium]MBT7326891.1 MerR family transcriptional regulator [Anaerolineae bacterium]
MKISEVSQECGVSADTLRYYERIGLLSPVNRTESGIRDYDEGDLKRVEFVKCMRSAGLPIEVLIEYVGLVAQGDKTAEMRREILVEQRELLLNKIEGLEKVLGILDHKIEVYNQIMLRIEQNFAEKELETEK